ncbi:hypothetical protein PRZ48_011713 [Zasmidium cellare]|uniref:Uncharacterized protein n=1 Tax=Zasmidium cellare TaxID=395010 RepID=A0ABR0E847_ZASCE|nr:hypothetical protein PRZ48_011713 [Zasmidium cellare]
MEDTSDKAFTERFNAVAQLCDENKLDDCIEQARELLDEPVLPRYHRMKTWVLLGAIVGDWEEANDCCARANSLWRIVRRWHPAGVNEKTDRAMQELRDMLDELEETLKEEEPPGHDFGDDEEDMVAEHDAAIGEDNVDAEAEAENWEELPMRAAALKIENECSKQHQQSALKSRILASHCLGVGPTFPEGEEAGNIPSTSLPLTSSRPPAADYTSDSLLSPALTTLASHASLAARQPFKPPKASRNISRLAANFEEDKEDKEEAM